MITATKVHEFLTFTSKNNARGRLSKTNGRRLLILINTTYVEIAI